MGVGSSKKREQERLEEERKKKEEQVQKAKEDIDNKIKEMEAKLEEFKKRGESYKDLAKKKLKEGDKSGAKHQLYKKKKIDEQIEKLNNALIMLDDQSLMIENAQIFGGITGVVKDATDALKNEQKDLHKSKIEDIYASLNDLKAKFKEVGDFIEVANQQNFEEEGIEDDFEDFEKKVMECEEKEFPQANTEKIEKDKDKNNKNDMIELI